MIPSFRGLLARIFSLWGGVLLLCLTIAIAGDKSVVSAAAQSPARLADWSEYAEQMREAGEKALRLQPETNDAQARQEASQAFVGAIAAAYLMAVYSDPDYPEFVPMWNSAFNVLGPVPDTVYSYTRINGSGIYRIRGF